MLRLGRGVAPVLFGSAATAAAAVLCLLAGARWLVPAADGPLAEGGWTRRSRAAFVPSGFHSAEWDPAKSRSFSWSSDHAEIRFPALRRTRAYAVTLVVRGGRPADAAPAHVTVAVDGQRRFSGTIAGDPAEIAFEIPRAERSGATVTLDVADVYRPGNADPRALGVIVDRVAISPVNGPFVPTARTMGLAATAVFLASTGLMLCGLRGALGLAASAGVALAFVWLLLQDAAFLGVYAERLVRLGAAGGVIGAAVGLLRRRWPIVAGVPEWSVAAGLVLAVSLFKLGVFAHPLTIVGDGIFQVHRAQIVHGGQYFFTSVTPKPFFEFPYPVALYVFALPFWSWFPTELDLLRLLRIVAIAADGVTGVVLYGAVRKQLNSRAAGLLCAVLWPFAKAPLEALSNANLTNVFGQSVFGAAAAGLAWMAAVPRASAAAWVLVTALLAGAFLSHFGTVTVGVVVLAVVCVLFLAGKGQPRRFGLLVFAALFTALLASWVVYYSHFIDVYQRSWTAVAERQSDDSSKIVAAPSVKLSRWWSGIGDDYGRPGIPVLLAALAGVVLLRRPRATGASLVFLGWLLAWVALSALGVLTPFTLRANLAAAPAFIALSAVSIAALAHTRAGALTAAIVAVLVAWDGLQIITACLQLTTNN